MPSVSLFRRKIRWAKNSLKSNPQKSFPPNRLATFVPHSNPGNRGLQLRPREFPASNVEVCAEMSAGGPSNPRLPPVFIGPNIALLPSAETCAKSHEEQGL